MKAVPVQETHIDVPQRQQSQQTGLLDGRRVSRCRCPCSKRTLCEIAVVAVILGVVVTLLGFARTKL